MDIDELRVRLTAVEYVLATVIRNLPEVSEQLEQLAIGLDAPPVVASDELAAALASSIRAFARGRPGLKPTD